MRVTRVGKDHDEANLRPVQFVPLIAFRNSMIELGLLGFMVLVLALSMFFLDRTSPQEGLQRE
jgi:hypothetical protein